MTTINLKLSQIMLDGGTQARTKINFKYIAKLVEEINGGKKFEPVVVFFDDSKYWLADGFHRARAAVDAGVSSIPAEVKSGGRREALIFSLEKAAREENYRTNSDKQRAISLLLSDEEWCQWSNQTIAETLNVSSSFVSTWRKKITNKESDQDGGQTKSKKPGRKHRSHIGSPKQKRFVEQKLALTEDDLLSISSAERCLVIDPYLASIDTLSNAIELLKAYYKHKTGVDYPDTP